MVYLKEIGLKKPDSICPEKMQINTFLHLFIYFVSLCLNVGKHLSWHPCGGQRQPVGVGSLFLPCVLGDNIKVSRHGDKHIYLLSHLSGP